MNRCHVCRGEETPDNRLLFGRYCLACYRRAPTMEALADATADFRAELVNPAPGRRVPVYVRSDADQRAYARGLLNSGYNESGIAKKLGITPKEVRELLRETPEKIPRENA